MGTEWHRVGFKEREGEREFFFFSLHLVMFNQTGVTVSHLIIAGLILIAMFDSFYKRTSRLVPRP